MEKQSQSLLERAERIVEKGIREDKIAERVWRCCMTGATAVPGVWHGGQRAADSHADRQHILDISMTAVTAVVTIRCWKTDCWNSATRSPGTFRLSGKNGGCQAASWVPANREIRIQDLLNMTSGIPYPDLRWGVSQKEDGRIL